MKTKKSKKDIVWGLNYHLHAELHEARDHHHRMFQAQREKDGWSEKYHREERDKRRETAFLLASILTAEITRRRPKDILLKVRLLKMGETTI